MYRSLAKDLDAFIADGYKKYADEEGRFYLSYLDAHNDRAKFLEEIVANVDGMAPKLKKEIMSLVDATYKESYTGMVKAMKKADKAKRLAKVIKDLSVRPEVLKRAINNNISKLTLEPVLQKQRAEVISQIQQELNIGLMKGDRYETMAKRISDRVDVSYNKAMNIVRTESHRNIESGLMDGAVEVSQGFEEEGYIYAATWCTREDERVRPQVRRKTAKGWKTYGSKNGANHIIMNNVTVRAGDMFDLGDGAEARAPGESGEARHDCNCRCFVEYNIMTPEEFAKATQSTPEEVIKKYNIKV
jgi:uncharacterized protein with gpF-like domain